MSASNPSSIEVQRSELSAVLGANAADAEVLGRAMQYRAGDVLAPRDWLLRRCRELDIPEQIIPSQPTPHAAYKRAMRRLVTSNPQIQDERTDRRYVYHEAVDDTLRVDLRLKDGDGNVKHLWADVFFPEELTGAEGGRWVDHRLGWFDYDVDGQSVRTRPDDDLPEALEALWADMAGRAMRLHKYMQEHHTGQDLRNMVYLGMVRNSPPEWPDIIPLIDRGGFYFVPEGGLTDIIDNMAVIFEEANQFKTGGSTMAIRTLEVMDTDDKNAWIQSRVESKLEKVVDDALDEAFDALEDGEETAAQIVDTMAERLEVEGRETADQYNALLQAKLDVEQILASEVAGLKADDRKELVEKAVEKADL